MDPLKLENEEEILSRLSNVCQACLASGTDTNLKDMMGLYAHIGKMEMYSSMMGYCFSINVGVEERQCGGSYMICECCIDRLREAASFRSQVESAQENIRLWLDRKDELPSKVEPMIQDATVSDNIKCGSISLDDVANFSDEESAEDALPISEITRQSKIKQGKTPTPLISENIIEIDVPPLLTETNKPEPYSRQESDHVSFFNYLQSTQLLNPSNKEKDSTHPEQEFISESSAILPTTQNTSEEGTSDNDMLYNKSKKRTRNPEMWKKNISKNSRQSGKEYTNARGTSFGPRKIRENLCSGKCPKNCYSKITRQEQEVIHSQFWSLSDEHKQKFYSQFIAKVGKKKNKNVETRRGFTYNYFFEVSHQRVPVCKNFFCGTLDISDRRVQYYFSKGGIAQPYKHGKYVKRVTPVEKVEEVRAHISGLPTVACYYCRTTTQKQYLKFGLNLAKLYKLYTEKYPVNPVKKNIYDKIFNKEFNYLCFFKSKKDGCDYCRVSAPD